MIESKLEYYISQVAMEKFNLSVALIACMGDDEKPDPIRAAESRAFRAEIELLDLESRAFRAEIELLDLEIKEYEASHPDILKGQL